jgi:hypothetical protein
MHFNTRETSKTDAFTQGCRDFVRTFTYEDILACTVYAPPLFFMVGPAAIAANEPLIIVVLHAILGFALSWTLHRTGHRLLIALPKGSWMLYLAPSVRLPVKLTLSQFLWMMEISVGGAAFCGILGKRFFMLGNSWELVTSLCFFALGLALFFVPVYLGRLWIERYYPAMALLGPTEDVINKSFPGIRSIFK